MASRSPPPADRCAGEQKLGYFEFFKTLMSGVQDMRADVKAGLSDDPGTPAGRPDLNVDPATFGYPGRRGSGLVPGGSARPPRRAARSPVARVRTTTATST